VVIVNEPKQPSLPGVDAPIGEKVDYVKSQSQTRGHTCHWPNCKSQVPPAMWGCQNHWYALPRNLRIRIWALYRPGQETDFSPSDDYMDLMETVQNWIATSHVPDNTK